MPASRLHASKDHDAFRGFRSKHLDVDIHLEVNKVVDEMAAEDAGLLFYSNTLSWLSQLRQLLGKAGSPVRKGNLFTSGGLLRPSSAWAPVLLPEAQHRTRRYVKTVSLVRFSALSPLSALPFCPLFT